MKKIFVIIEDWKSKSGETGINSSVCSTFEKALNVYNRRKVNCEIDYETDSRKDKVDIYETLDLDKEIADCEVIFNDKIGDYYHIWIEEKIIDEEV